MRVGTVSAAPAAGQTEPMSTRANPAVMQSLRSVWGLQGGAVYLRFACERSPITQRGTCDQYRLASARERHCDGRRAGSADRGVERDRARPGAEAGGTRRAAGADGAPRGAAA